MDRTLGALTRAGEAIGEAVESLLEDHAKDAGELRRLKRALGIGTAWPVEAVIGRLLDGAAKAIEDVSCSCDDCTALRAAMEAGDEMIRALTREVGQTDPAPAPTSPTLPADCVCPVAPCCCGADERSPHVATDPNVPAGQPVHVDGKAIAQLLEGRAYPPEAETQARTIGAGLLPASEVAAMRKIEVDARIGVPVTPCDCPACKYLRGEPGGNRVHICPQVIA